MSLQSFYDLLVNEQEVRFFTFLAHNIHFYEKHETALRPIIEKLVEDASKGNLLWSERTLAAVLERLNTIKGEGGIKAFYHP